MSVLSHWFGFLQGLSQEGMLRLLMVTGCWVETQRPWTGQQHIRDLRQADGHSTKVFYETDIASLWRITSKSDTNVERKLSPDKI